jgi:ATP-dependent DNA helicase RecQ
MDAQRAGDLRRAGEGEPIMSQPAPDLAASLRDLFGFPSFRPGQEDLVRRALAGRDSLAVMPTGSGKSVCYQLPAMLRPTPTLVISPLIALMRDQVAHLPPGVRERAAFINSTVDAGEASAHLADVAAGRVKLLYAAPERLRQGRFAEAMRAARVGLVVVDEAHCVALWGHDFRPDYLFIRSVLAGPLRDASVLALTATATPETAAEIGRGLGRDLDVVRASVVRENLRYDVVRVGNEEERLRFVLERAATWPGAGIIYIRARERCERVAALLARQGVAAAPYHALLPREERASTQERFLSGELRVVVATTAFGMGVDKPDIRWVLLYNYPTSIEEYVQQVGRAGRDGAPSTCTLLASQGDAASLRAFAKRDTPSVDELRQVWAALRSAAAGGGDLAVTPAELQAAASLPEGRDPRIHCGLLERAGLLERHFDAGPAMRLSLLPPPGDAAERVAELVDRLAAAARARCEAIIAFAASPRCRHAQVARHFGDTVQTPCGRCDVCAPARTAPAPDPRPAPPPLPADPAAAIVDAVATLRWPLGVRGLLALLRGSVAAPPSARRHPAFGAMAGASESMVERWVGELLKSGHLKRLQGEGGFPVLVVARRDGLPRLGGAVRQQAAPRREGKAPEGEAATRFAALRAWRAATARSAGIPAYMVLHDATLAELAADPPADLAGLARVRGIGSRKLDTWGQELLEVLRRGF